jgi:hypothetical protein
MVGIGTDISKQYIDFAKKRIALDNEEIKEEKIQIKNLVLKNNPKKQFEIKFN